MHEENIEVGAVISESTGESEKCQYRCSDGACYMEAWRCNYIAECRDMEDELNCDLPYSTATGSSNEL
ncbi:hypothetical protein MAR_026555 [Mya arenaria]|uniref:Uncharacterized protein n=1 Tax=Mya arenaria TaxID=6604 RepID=A0ABY7ERA5_MYAAR|nr:hypothetical protein MAR_026555 [Mya arenaria]